jgi:hypothetical protein
MHSGDAVTAGCRSFWKGDDRHSPIIHRLGKSCRELEVGSGYAVARCGSWPPRRTLTTFDTPGSCIVTP